MPNLYAIVSTDTDAGAEVSALDEVEVWLDVTSALSTYMN